MRKTIYVLGAAAVMLCYFSGILESHCEIPCGIYDDRARIESIREHVATIEKSIKQIQELQKASPVNFNQLVRWIDNKEVHASKIQEIVCQYFLTQRIKPDTKDYHKKLESLHKLLLYAMKSKQTVDLELPQTMLSELKTFEGYYFDH